MKKILRTLIVFIFISCFINIAKAETQLEQNVDSNELFEEVVLSTPQIQDDDAEETLFVLSDFVLLRYHPNKSTENT